MSVNSAVMLGEIVCLVRCHVNISNNDELCKTVKLCFVCVASEAVA